jgi:Domain of unknown function (DUF4278)
MLLTYRGVTHEGNFVPLEMEEGAIAGKYRGVDWRYRYPRHVPQSEPKPYRQYRGVSYSTSPVSERREPPKISCPLPLNQPTPIEQEGLSTVHLDNIRRRLERRLQIAQENGDENLLEMLQKESQDLSLQVGSRLVFTEISTSDCP